jgi:putative acetyltransferase
VKPSHVIEVERAADHAGIRAVHSASFPTPAEARLVDALRASGRLTISLVAHADNAVVGHVAFSPVSIGDIREAGLGLGPVAVLSPWRRRGVAAALIERGLWTCSQLGVGFVVVLGEPHYYRRFGFRRASTRGLKDEYGGGDAFQALELRPGAIPPGGGRVSYAPEFAEATGDETA